MRAIVTRKMSFLVFVVVVVVSVYLWRMRRFYYASFKMKGPLSLPVIGSCLEFLGTTEGAFQNQKLCNYQNSLLDILQSTARMVDKYETPFRLWVGTRFLVGIANPEDFEVVLNNSNCLAKEELYRFFSELIGDSIFSLQNGNNQIYKKYSNFCV